MTNSSKGRSSNSQGEVGFGRMSKKEHKRVSQLGGQHSHDNDSYSSSAHNSESESQPADTR